MLKITLLDTVDELRFRLEGRLSGAWVAEFGQSWRTAKSTLRGRRTVVDLSDVDFADGEAGSLLTEMRREGVRLHAVTPLMHALVDEIESAVSKPLATVSGNPA